MGKTVNTGWNGQPVELIFLSPDGWTPLTDFGDGIEADTLLKILATPVKDKDA